MVVGNYSWVDACYCLAVTGTDERPMKRTPGNSRPSEKAKSAVPICTFVNVMFDPAHVSDISDDLLDDATHKYPCIMRSDSTLSVAAFLLVCAAASISIMLVAWKIKNLMKVR